MRPNVVHPNVLHPQVLPGLTPMWRQPGCVQLGIDPAAQFRFDAIGPEARHVMGLLDGTRTVAQATAQAHRQCLRSGSSQVFPDDVLTQFHSILTDADQPLEALNDLTRTQRNMLIDQLHAAALRLRHQVHLLGATPSASLVPDNEVGLITRRRRKCLVALASCGPLGLTVGRLLAAAGVGALLVTDDRPVTHPDLVGTGLGKSQLRTPRNRALAQLLGPTTATTVHLKPPTLATGAPWEVNLAVMCHEWDDGSYVDLLEHSDALMRAGIVHLYAEVRETLGVLGPVVVPGWSSCRRCVELTRTESDPDHPALMAQLTGRCSRSRPSEVTLTHLVAAQCAYQVLVAIDLGLASGEVPVPGSAALTNLKPLLVNATLETSQVTGESQRHPWPPHPLCGCSWQHDLLGEGPGGSTGTDSSDLFSLDSRHQFDLSR